MQTDNVFACHVEGDDIIVSGEFTYFVIGITETPDDFILFDTRDDDGETTQLSYGPFDTVVIATKLDEEDDLSWVDTDDLDG